MEKKLLKVYVIHSLIFPFRFIGGEERVGRGAAIPAYSKVLFHLSSGSAFWYQVPEDSRSDAHTQGKVSWLI